MSTTYAPPAGLSANAHVKSLEEYKALYTKSIEQPEEFWGEILKTFHFETPYTEFHSYNYDRTKGKVEINWFKGSKTNLCYNALDRHVLAGKGDQIAFFWEGNDPADASTITYGQLLKRVCKFANALKSLGVEKGHTVAIYQPMIVDLVVAMLACARIGAIHSIIFGGFSAEAFADRIIDAQSNVVITADGVYRGAKHISLKEITDDAIAKCEARGFVPRTCVVSRNRGEHLHWHDGRDLWFHELEAAASEDCPVEWMDAEAPLFMLYTSGSTGKPKGVVHTTAGYMVWAATTFKYTFDYQAGDVYWCTADIGWITGHSYITYGPLINGATSVMFEGIPTFPDAGRFWAVVDKYKVTQFYTAPTAIRTLMRFGDEFPAKYDLSSLKILGSVGEPINPEAWIWYHDVIGRKRCAVVDTWWQTETGGHMITPLPGATPTKPGSATLPMFGVVPVLLDNDGKEIEGAGEGFLMVKKPWPGQMRTVYGDHDRFEVTYFSQFNGYYCTGDGCRRDEDGYYWITGRIDDVINVSGHRIGTAELEAALATHPDVVESAVVGIPHDIKGQGIYAYVICKDGVELTPAKAKDLQQHIRVEIGPFAQPDIVQFTHGLPKTRSGKIMRRILRKIACHEEDSLGDLSTLADPTVIESLLALRPKLK